MPTDTHFLPPENYQQIKSAIDGISVFAPRPKADTSGDARSYDCPQCGASLAFDLTSSQMGCPYCGYQQSIEAQHVGLSAKRSEFTLETVEAAQRGWGSLRSVLTCENCGAELSFPTGSIAATCPYCASNKVNVQVAKDDKLRPRFLVPFKIKSDQLPQLSAAWLGKGWFHPKKLAARTILRHFNGIYLPYWAFDARVETHWRAEVGHQESYRYYNASQKRWETRTKIVWEWKEGEQNLPFNNQLQFGIGGKHIDHNMLQKISTFSLTDLVAYQPDFLVGLQAQAYDIKLTDAWEKTKMILRESAKNSCRAAISSPYVRNFSMSADFEDETWRYILLPIYLASYRFNEKVYQVMVNGQTGTIAGQKPVAWSKVRWATAASLLPAFIFGLISLITYFVDGSVSPLLCLGIILLIIGAVISLVIHRKAHQAEKGS